MNITARKKVKVEAQRPSAAIQTAPESPKLDENGADVGTTIANSDSDTRELTYTPSEIHHEPLLAEKHHKSWYHKLKAIFDISLGVLLLIIFSPAMLLAYLLVKLTSPGPAIYSQTRVGLMGKPFTIYKFRSMKHRCESLTGAQWSKPGDTRVTPVGKFLRKTHLDELPQLWNVIRGEMSLVGPRPERPEFVPQLMKAIPLYACRLQVKPGVTGFAQVQLPPDTDLNSVQLKLAYDLFYIKNLSFWFDFRLMMATFLKLFCFSYRAIRFALNFSRKSAITKYYVNIADKLNDPFNKVR